MVFENKQHRGPLNSNGLTLKFSRSKYIVNSTQTMRCENHCSYSVSYGILSAWIKHIYMSVINVVWNALKSKLHICIVLYYNESDSEILVIIHYFWNNFHQRCSVLQQFSQLNTIETSKTYFRLRSPAGAFVEYRETYFSTMRATLSLSSVYVFDVATILKSFTV